VKERYPFSEDVCHTSNEITMDTGIQHMRELAMWDLVYYDLDNEQLPTDPDEVQGT